MHQIFPILLPGLIPTPYSAVLDDGCCHQARSEQAIRTAINVGVQPTKRLMSLLDDNRLCIDQRNHYLGDGNGETSRLSFGTSNGRTAFAVRDGIHACMTRQRRPVIRVWANKRWFRPVNFATHHHLHRTMHPAPKTRFYWGDGGASSGGFHPVVLYLNQTMNAIHPTMVSGSGLPTSCSSSPSLPSGITLSSTCVISGTPNATDNGVSTRLHDYGNQYRR